MLVRYENARPAVKPIALRKTKVCETLCKRRARAADISARFAIAFVLRGRNWTLQKFQHRYLSPYADVESSAQILRQALALK
ncbi:hypothetical protein EVAR_80016_1 [Eumeta japonica]|uniref:Uncharacterized protein n=1 Tax=Eumeta variegata TaxID=151549 RepID=A0A4C1WKY7_EUMVA|nr:hypothetical protein EVAR_80016_1 [Eumeta japonica]